MITIRADSTRSLVCSLCCVSPDTPNKIFFEKYKSTIKQKYIYSLRDDHGCIKKEPTDILSIGRNYYENLFKKKVGSR